MTGRISAALLLCALGLVPRTAFAWFQVCNQRQSGGYVAYSHYLSNTSLAQSECSESRLEGDCYYSSWRTEGWWRVEPGQCVIVMGEAITNQFIYVHADFDDGAVLGDGTSFYVRQRRFLWDAQVESHYGGGECIASSGVYDFCTPQGYWTGFHEVDTGIYGNFTLNIT